MTDVYPPQAQDIPSSSTYGPRMGSSALETPGNTPPPTASFLPFSTPFSEARLQQLLAHVDSGTHNIDREERETAEERRISFGENSLPTPPTSQPSSRRQSFLSSLSFGRFGSNPASATSSATSTPVQTPVTPSYPKDAPRMNLPSSLVMTSSGMNQVTDPIERPKSTPTVPTMDSSLPFVPAPGQVGHAPVKGQILEKTKAMEMQRSNTSPPGMAQPVSLSPLSNISYLHRKASLGQGLAQKPGMGPMATEEKRHFDPSKEPRLLGII